MTLWVPAVLAFIAFGANLLTGALLLLFNPRHRGIRWYVLFVAGICVWLLSQGVLLIRNDWSGAWDIAHGTAIFLLPGLFLASAFAETGTNAQRYSVLVILINIAILPLMMPDLIGRDSLPITAPLIWTWQIAGWSAGSYLHYCADWRTSSERGAAAPRALIGLFLLVAPLSVVGAQLLGSDNFFLYVMPPLTIVIQFMIFVGVTRLRFYDIEVRAARSGEIATRATETERMAVLGELAATIAHEVRNPLTGMRSLAQRIADDEVEPARRAHYATVILDEIGRIERMVSNLLDVARRSPVRSARTSDVDLHSLFGDLTLLLGAQARQRNVVLETLAHGVHVTVSREALAQALLNLTINAIAHAPAGSVVRLSARNTQDGVEIVVRDAGPGIPVADRARIFEPFHTTRADGSGLGLTVVRRLAAELDWEVDVRDAAGGGAEFLLRIPTFAEVQS